MNHYAINRVVYGACRVFLSSYFKLLHGFRVQGAENVPKKGGALIVSNHASFLDPAVLGSAVWHRDIHFMARDTLFRNTFAKLWATSVGVVPINRNKGDLRALRDAVAIVNDGDILCLFPEGTRTPDGRLQSAKAGIGFLVEKSGVPAVPVFVKGTFQALPRNARWLSPGRITVTFGAPILPAEIGQFGNDPDRRQKIADLVMARIAALNPISVSRLYENVPL